VRRLYDHELRTVWARERDDICETQFPISTRGKPEATPQCHTRSKQLK
jgi:hypothetical protein